MDPIVYKKKKVDTHCELFEDIDEHIHHNAIC